MKSDKFVDTSIVLLNMGGPKSQDEIRPFLYNLFADPELIRLPTLMKPLQKPLAWLIAKMRTQKTAKMYEQIGGGSPIVSITESLAEKLETELAAKSTVAMRYNNPRAQDALQKIRNKQHIILFSQYPHYAESTSESSIRDFHRQLALLNDYKPKITEIKEWGTEPEYIDWWVKGLQKALAKVADNSNVHVIFSAHGLPERYIKQGEKYPERLKASMNRIISHIDLPLKHYLAFQSKNGPLPWTQPYTNELLLEIAKIEPSAVIIVPLGFVTDHVETLYEIDILFKQLALTAGIPQFIRVDVPNADDEYAKSIAQMLRRMVMQ